ncbi:MAG: hypothetical protein HQL46_06315 [Gammaproteobacteria bacterium]|nr:hypothetical protein [Gammaproteobacteria bacterium]
MKKQTFSNDNNFKNYVNASKSLYDLSDDFYIKDSRMKKKHKKRRKHDEFIERKEFKNFYNKIRNIHWDLED